MNTDITTTAGETFSLEEHRTLASLMFKRFGRDRREFCQAWRRMMQSLASDSEIMELVTPSRCNGFV